MKDQILITMLKARDRWQAVIDKLEQEIDEHINHKDNPHCDCVRCEAWPYDLLEWLMK